MQTTFLNAAGTVLFVRDDMEQGNWTQEEYSVNATFPYVAGKVIERGQRIAFRDPATDTLEMFEIRNVTNIEPEHYQQIVAEHIVISELCDEHIDNKEFTNVPPQTALSSVLTGTLWAVGNVDVGNLAEQAAIRAQISALGLNGNVDLTSRPIISPDTMHRAGYSDFDGDYATLYSMTYVENSSTGATFTVLATPIMHDGTVLSQSAIDDYVLGMYGRATNLASFKTADTKGLLIHVLSGEQISQMDNIAVEAHDLSDEWEQLNAGISSSGDISRGSVWQAVGAISTNWNVYITPRVTVNAAGNITGRYLDIAPAQGTWRGVRLSIDKNMADSSVEYDDSEVLTALYGYGGSVDVPQASGDDKSEELTFANVVWSATSAHPAKPSGQTYLEDPSKTALYGRNGRPRFGYYQNGDIKDANTLLEKTWEALKQTFSPKISITGTVADLYRLGYTDQPLRLHDTVIVEIRQTGETFQKEIIKLDVDLIDPTATRPTIGDYIQNIVYINRDTNKKATGGGGGGGGGGGRGMTNLEDMQTRYFTWFDKNDKLIGMFAGIKDGDEYLKVGRICLEINDSDDILAYIDADHINISATSTVHTLAGDIEHDANGRLIIKNAGGMYVQRTEGGITSEFGVWDNGNVTAGMIATVVNGVASTYIKGDKIIMGNGENAETVINGKASISDLDAANARITNLTSGNTTASTLKTILLSASTGFNYQGHAVSIQTVTIDGNTYQFLGV